MHHHTWLSPKDEPGALGATGPEQLTACTWDLAVITHERAAWVRHVLARLGGDRTPTPTLATGSTASSRDAR
jgi:hypothetical protein